MHRDTQVALFLAFSCAVVAARGQAPEVTNCATVCPDGQRVTFVCSQTPPCNWGTVKAPTSGGSSTSASSTSSFQEAQLNLAYQFGQQLGTAIANWMQQSDAEDEAKRARAREIARQQKAWAEAEAKRQADEYARKQQEIYEGLSKSLRRVGTPGELSLRRSGSDPGLSIRRSGAGPDVGGDNTAQKSSSGSGPGYGIPGLPGVYVGGPRGSAPTLGAILAESTTAPVVKGDLQQAAQLVAAASKAPESVRGVLYDVAANAAGGDKSVTQWVHTDTSPPTVTDEQVHGFQQTENAYREARVEKTSAAEAVSQASAQHDATQELIHATQSDLDASKAHLSDPATLHEKEQALADLMAAEKAQRDALRTAHANLDQANAKFEQARSAAVSGLRSLAGISDEAASARARDIFDGSASALTSTNTVDLRDRTSDSPRLLRSPPANVQSRVAKASPDLTQVDKPTVAEMQRRLAALRHEVDKLKQAIDWLNKSASSTKDDRLEWMDISHHASLEAMNTGLDLVVDVSVYYTGEIFKGMLKDQTDEIRSAIDQMTSETEPGRKERLQLAIKAMERNRQTIKTAQREVKLADIANSADQLRRIDRDADKSDIEKALESAHVLASQVLDNGKVKDALKLDRDSKIGAYATFAKDLADAGCEVAAQAYSVWGIKETETEMSTYLSTLKAVKQRMEVAEKNIRTVEAELNAAQSGD